MERKKNYSTKRTPSKGPKKHLPCLGPGCKKILFTTIEERICLRCKKAIDKIEDLGEYVVVRGPTKRLSEV